MLAEHNVTYPEEIPDPVSQDGATSFTEETMSILTSSNMLARSFLIHPRGLRRKECSETDVSNTLRHKREFITTEKKDEGYWDKRKKNNEAARRSREKRRFNDIVVENKVLALLEDNAHLKAELLALKFQFGLIKDPTDSLTPTRSSGSCTQPFPATRYYCPNSNSQLTHRHSLTDSHHGGSDGVQSIRDRVNVSEDSGFSISGGSSIGSPEFSDDAVGEPLRGYPYRGGEETECKLSPYITPVDTNSSDREKLVSVWQENSMKGLPHKLRFKTPGGTEGEVFLPVEMEKSLSSTMVGLHHSSQVREQSTAGRTEGLWRPQPHTMPPTGSTPHHNYPAIQRHCSMENDAIRSQLSSLTEEVAQLKKLVSQRLLPKLN
ncbi:nuclear factor interleukin-3-regulated protein-like [Myxocyprinus asiaticus]|uniref:nuclear factor interleukin-3-regulated protein-like n=1 Tax=Myxocyprinus asiaticus TaxID=70543 RepID=UPI002222B224|nr:nuclear factor interleukin-3-regulated protein-like [Myxocyprinus asiaticus]XP_051563699.1 nuclear factor interleukin-3-regulated protein-like [Myxocyprinus asiaticus]XP_051563700.1 nuclear factor interleukin-3-regulated protein-like [Myxocyprinus asiaticus]